MRTITSIGKRLRTIIGAKSAQDADRIGVQDLVGPTTRTDPTPQPPPRDVKALSQQARLEWFGNGPANELQHLFYGFQSQELVDKNTVNALEQGYQMCAASSTSTGCFALLCRPSGVRSNIETRVVECMGMASVKTVLEMAGLGGWAMTDVDCRATNQVTIHLNKPKTGAVEPVEYSSHSARDINGLFEHVLDAQKHGWEVSGHCSGMDGLLRVLFQTQDIGHAQAAFLARSAGELGYPAILVKPDGSSGARLAGCIIAVWSGNPAVLQV